MQWPIYEDELDIKAIWPGGRSRCNSACSLRILHARSNEVCFVGGNLRGCIEGGGWRVMYTRARGVEVGKWPARRARRPTDLERYRSAAVATDNTRPPSSAATTKTLLCLPTIKCSLAEKRLLTMRHV